MLYRIKVYNAYSHGMVAARQTLKHKYYAWNIIKYKGHMI